MKKQKEFDEVEMKWEIQRQLMEELDHLPAEQDREVQRQRIEEDPVLGPFLRQVRTLSASPLSEQRELG